MLLYSTLFATLLALTYGEFLVQTQVDVPFDSVSYPTDVNRTYAIVDGQPNGVIDPSQLPCQQLGGYHFSLYNIITVWDNGYVDILQGDDNSDPNARVVINRTYTWPAQAKVLVESFCTVPF